MILAELYLPEYPCKIAYSPNEFDVTLTQNY